MLEHRAPKRTHGALVRIKGAKKTVRWKPYGVIFDAADIVMYPLKSNAPYYFVSAIIRSSAAP